MNGKASKFSVAYFLTYIFRLHIFAYYKITIIKDSYAKSISNCVLRLFRCCVVAIDDKKCLRNTVYRETKEQKE